MSPRRGFVPPRQRCLPSLMEQVRCRLFPPSYRDYPWPIPYETGRRWSTAAYLRANGLLESRTRRVNVGADLRLLVLAVALCLCLVIVMNALVHLARWVTG